MAGIRYACGVFFGWWLFVICSWLICYWHDAGACLSVGMDTDLHLEMKMKIEMEMKTKRGGEVVT